MYNTICKWCGTSIQVQKLMYDGNFCLDSTSNKCRVAAHRLRKKIEHWQSLIDEANARLNRFKLRRR